MNSNHLAAVLAAIAFATPSFAAVEVGAWHDDAGNRLIILVNHDIANPQEAKLPNGKTVRLEPGRAKTIVLP